MRWMIFAAMLTLFSLMAATPAAAAILNMSP